MTENQRKLPSNRLQYVNNNTRRRAESARRHGAVTETPPSLRGRTNHAPGRRSSPLSCLRPQVPTKDNRSGLKPRGPPSKRQRPCQRGDQVGGGRRARPFRSRGSWALAKRPRPSPPPPAPCHDAAGCSGTGVKHAADTAGIKATRSRVTRTHSA